MVVVKFFNLDPHYLFLRGTNYSYSSNNRVLYDIQCFYSLNFYNEITITVLKSVLWFFVDYKPLVEILPYGSSDL